MDNDVLVFRISGEVLRIDVEGSVFWKGKKMLSDDDFKKGLLELVDCFISANKTE